LLQQVEFLVSDVRYEAHIKLCGKKHDTVMYAHSPARQPGRNISLLLRSQTPCTCAITGSAKYLLVAYPYLYHTVVTWLLY